MHSMEIKTPNSLVELRNEMLGRKFDAQMGGECDASFSGLKRDEYELARRCFVAGYNVATIELNQCLATPSLKEFEAISTEFDNNPIVQKIARQYVSCEIATKEEALFQMVKGLCADWDAIAKRNYEAAMMAYGKVEVDHDSR